MASFTLPDDASQRIRQIFGYWQSKCGARPFPSRADIDPVEIPRLLPYITMVDVRREAPRFVFRLVGTEAARLLMADLTGKPVGVGIKPSELPEVLSRFTRVADGYECIYHRKRMQRDANDFMTVDRIMLPLGPAPDRVDIVLSLVTASDDQRAPDVP